MKEPESLEKLVLFSWETCGAYKWNKVKHASNSPSISVYCNRFKILLLRKAFMVGPTWQDHSIFCMSRSSLLGQLQSTAAPKLASMPEFFPSYFVSKGQRVKTGHSCRGTGPYAVRRYFQKKWGNEHSYSHWSTHQKNLPTPVKQSIIPVTFNPITGKIYSPCVQNSWRVSTPCNFKMDTPIVIKTSTDLIALLKYIRTRACLAHRARLMKDNFQKNAFLLKQWEFHPTFLGNSGNWSNRVWPAPW